MVAFHDKNTSSLFFTVFIFLLFYNLILSIIIIFLAPFISHNLLHNDQVYLAIIAIALSIPFTTLSNTIKSYYIGNERMLPTVLSNIIENIFRLSFIILFSNFLLKYSLSIVVFFLISINIISELLSCLTLYLFSPTKKFYSVSFKISYLKEILHLSIPNIVSTIIGNGTYFLEPIILSSVLLYLGYSNHYITLEYGIITAYIFPLLSFPSFFILAFSQALLPELTKEVKSSNFIKIKKIVFFQVCFIFLFSICISICFIVFGKQILLLLYHTSSGYSYLKFLSYFSFFYYIQPIPSFLFLSFGNTKENLYTTIFSSLVRIISLVIFLFLGFGMNGFLLSFLFNIILTTIFQFYRLFFVIKKED